MNAFIAFFLVAVVVVTVAGNQIGCDDERCGCFMSQCPIQPDTYPCDANNFCYPPLCVDKLDAQGINECPANAHLCNDDIYRDLMTKECPKTCNRCGASPPPPPCADKVNAQGINECPSKAYLCNNNLYHDLMTQECPKTCNRCPQ